MCVWACMSGMCMGKFVTKNASTKAFPITNRFPDSFLELTT